MEKYNVRESMQCLLAAMCTQQIRHPGSPILYGRIERRFATIVFHVHIGPGSEQQPCHHSADGFYSYMQRRAATLPPDTRIGAGGQQLP